MKNKNLLSLAPILLPTKDASHLYIQRDKICYDSYIVDKLKDCNDQHLYLCSKREIKSKDYYHNAYGISKSAGGEIEKGDYKNCLKIEFTTDVKLIADGVPAIDGNTKAIINGINKKGGYGIEVNFLEEFVKRYNENRKGVDSEKLAREIVINSNPDGVWNFSQSTFNSLVKDITNALQGNDKKFSLKEMQDYTFEILKEMRRECSDWQKRGLTISDIGIAQFIKNPPVKEQSNVNIEMYCELHPRPITVGHTELGEEGKDWEWRVEPYQGKPTIYFK